jgi:hypothetical protein
MTGSAERLLWIVQSQSIENKKRLEAKNPRIRRQNLEFRGNRHPIDVEVLLADVAL